MKLNFVIFLNLLLFSSCLSEDVDGNSASINDFRHPNFNITEFFEKYEGREFNLQIENKTKVNVSPDSIYIPSYNLFLDLITQFGERISRIGIIRSSQIDQNDWAVLFQRINEHCSESLNSLVLERLKEYTFENFTKSFTEMEHLIFSFETNEVGSFLPLTTLFPNLQTLRIDYYNSEDNVENNKMKFIDIELSEMENLKEFGAFYKTTNHSDVEKIQKQLGIMFEKNPQIKKLSYSPVLDDFIQEISKHLPNLEDLRIHRVDTNIQPVRFDSVKNVIVTSWGQSNAIDKITFSHLDSLNMYYDGENDSWMAFLRNHRNLKKLDCKVIREKGFVEFVTELPNLHEISINSFESFNIVTVTQLIESTNNWVKFHYQSNPIDASDNYPDMVAFSEKFENIWQISYNFEGGPFIDLERKN